MSEKAQGMEARSLGAGTFLLRLVIVLAVVVAFVLLFKRATAAERQLQAVLTAENRALNRGDWEAFQALQDPQDQAFRRYQKDRFDSLQAGRERGEPWATEPQALLYVVQVGRQADQAWGLVMEDPEGDPATGPARIEFFRREYGEWLHTGPDANYWGPEQETASEHITWRYRQADAGQVARLAATAEILTGQVCDDTGLELVRPLAVNICYSMNCRNFFYPAGEPVELPTPLLFGFEEEAWTSLLAQMLATNLIGRAAGMDVRQGGSALVQDIASWEVTQILGDTWGDGRLAALGQAVADDALLGLQELDDPGLIDNAGLSYYETYTLVEYVVARYGRQALPALARAAGRHNSTVEVLQEALGADLDLAEFEASWLDFVREQYSQ